MKGYATMFTRKELEAIILLADVATKMERVLNIFGIEQSTDERIQALSIKKKAQEIHAQLEPTTDEKVEEILSK